MLTYADVCRYFGGAFCQSRAHVWCGPGASRYDVCSLTYADVCGRMLTYAERMFGVDQVLVVMTYAHSCMLTYADVC
jgi:hypothetical protein